VVVLIGRPGATSLGSGALDGPALDALGPSRPGVLTFVDALGAWQLTEAPCQLATNSGLLRASRGRDRCLVDLAALRNGVVGVVDASRAAWDAVGLARAWSAEPWARAHGLRFEPVAVDVLRYAHESVAPDVDLAAPHDDPARVAWLLERLKKAHALQSKCAIVLGPWLGTKTGVGTRLSMELGKPVGEPLSPPGGVCGLRFETARDALFAKIGASAVAGWAARLTSNGGTPATVRVELESGEAIDADAAVLAVGGLVGGGVRFEPRKPFELSLSSAAVLALRGVPLVTSGSPHGAPFETFAWAGHGEAAGFERVGVWTDERGRLRAADGSPRAGLFAAGDAVADAPRTLLDAIRLGVIAGHHAALAAAP
jgi:glycerol-3-phosphate dehydrogenase subunit B